MYQERGPISYQSHKEPDNHTTISNVRILHPGPAYSHSSDKIVAGREYTN